jgi:hypothetical protein
LHDGKKDVIPKSIQLIAGRTGRDYNIRKNRKGAFWEDRYHATAVKTDDHLIRCMAYIDLNMVRAGVVQHPSEWEFGGYTEIQNSKQRYTVINRRELGNLLGIKNDAHLLESHRQWVEEILKNGQTNGMRNVRKASRSEIKNLCRIQKQSWEQRPSAGKYREKTGIMS